MINMDVVVESGVGLMAKEQNDDKNGSITKIEELLIAEKAIRNDDGTDALEVEHKNLMAADDPSETKYPSGSTQPVIGSSPADDDGPTEAKQEPLACQPQSPEVDGSTPGSQKKCMRVSFPEHKVVSGYMDPPTPWNDASQCSTDELVAAYLGTCDKVGVKPNVRLLNQLQVITNFDDRNETLTLKNEHLDAKHCETLEEVFRRVQFRTIDLEATKLEEEGAVTIFDMIEYYESCLKLNISYSKNLGQRGWQACSRMIRKTPCLENLEARGSSLSDFVMPFLGRSLRAVSALTSLHLEFTATSGKPLQILVAALKVNETLKELYLADNKLMPSDGIQLGSLLKYNRTLHLLDLRNNHLQDTGFLHICEGIWEQGKGSGLNTLVIWNNQLSYQAMNHLSRALLNSTSLETLNLGHNNLTNEGMHRLKESLLKNKSLLRIGLQASKITCEGAVALAEFIAESTKLVRLDLRENEIKTGGLMALCLALKVSQSVTRVDLDKEPKKESGVKDYADQQKRLLADITNYMQRNRALARQREEDEIAQETDHNSSASPSTSAAEPEVRGESIPAAETMPQQHQSHIKSPDEVCAPPENKGEAVEAAEEKKEIENSPRHRMNLTLELKTRCQMLESPDFIPESEMLPVDLPSEEAVASATAQTPLAIRNKRKIMMDIPPSPMVSSQGRTVLVPVFEDPMSPSLDDMMPLTSKPHATKPDDVSSGLDAEGTLSEAVDSNQKSLLLSTQKAESNSDEFPGMSPNLGEASSMPSSPQGFFSSATSHEETASSTRPLLARSTSLPTEIQPGQSLQNKKSSLKMTRPKHRFQVSRAHLPHKPPLGRRGSGSHKVLPGVVADLTHLDPSEHSTADCRSSAISLTLPSTTFQFDMTLNSCAQKGNTNFQISEASGDHVDTFASLSTGTSVAGQSLPLVGFPVMSLGGQVTTEVDFHQADPVAPKFPLNDVKTTSAMSVISLPSVDRVLPNSIQVMSFHSENGAEAKLVCSSPIHSSIPGSTLLSAVDKTVDIEVMDDFPADHHEDLAETSGTSDGKVSAEAVRKETQEIPGLDMQNFSSLLSKTGNVTAATCKKNHGKKNGIADIHELHEMDDTSSSEKTASIANGLKLGFPQDITDVANHADDVRKLHLENTASNSGTSIPNE